MNGVDKASLGARYLLNYITTKNEAYLDVVKNCLKEIEFWALLMHFCNNMNELFDNIPESILTNVFCQKKIEKVVDVLNDKSTIEYDYGKGYMSNINGEYKTQLRLIRNALAHGTFTFDGSKIKVNNPNTEFGAIFDYEWFKTLVLVVLSNSNYLIKKNITDYVMCKLTDEDNLKANAIPSLEDRGSLKLIKLTCTAESAKNVVTKFSKLSDSQERLTFDSLKISFIRYLSNLAKKIGFNVALEKLKKAFKGIFNIEVIKITSPALQDESFLQLPLNDGIDLLINELSSENKVTRNTINLKRILELTDCLANNISISSSLEYSLKDTKEFLLNLYGYIFFSQNDYNTKKCGSILNSYQDKIDFRIIHAKKVWSEYIKKISRAIDTLNKANASPIRIKMWEKRLSIYKIRLNHAINDMGMNMLNLLRNSLTHGLVEHTPELITFYGEEPKIKLPKINAKTKELEETEFQNSSKTFELDINPENYLSLLDSLYENSGIEIKVNIAKYRKRKGYLES